MIMMVMIGDQEVHHIDNHHDHNRHQDHDQMFSKFMITIMMGMISFHGDDHDRDDQKI